MSSVDATDKQKTESEAAAEEDDSPKMYGVHTSSNNAPDQVFKIVPNPAYAAPNSSPEVSAFELTKGPNSAPANVQNGGGADQNGGGGKTTGGLLFPGSQLTKTRSDWFSSLFSPSKSRNNSTSTETSRSALN